MDKGTAQDFIDDLNDQIKQLRERIWQLQQQVETIRKETVGQAVVSVVNTINAGKIDPKKVYPRGSRHD